MKLSIKPWPYPKRKQLIESLQGSQSTFGTHTLKFMGQSIELPKYYVDYEMPVYRLSNGRTLDAQLQYIKRESKPEDFFTKDPESIEALNAQHEILKKLADEADLFDYFRNVEHEQDEPLLLDQSGFVVNGNRRLCVWRMLVIEDPVKYARYKRIQVVFLPQSDPKEIEILEAKLQTAPSIKAKYVWTTKALLFKRQMKEYRWSFAELAKIHELKPSDITDFISKLDEAEKFLSQIGMNREYSFVEKKEYGFERLIKLRPNLPNAQKREIFTQLCYNAFTSPEAIEDRVWKVVKEIYDSLDGIGEGLQKIFPKTFETQQGESKIEKTLPANDPLFSGVIGKSDAVNIQLIAELKKPENQESINQVLSNELERNRWIKRQQKEENSVLDYVSSAQSHLRNALLNLNSKSNLTGVSTQLDQIQSLLEELRKRIIANDHNNI